MIDLHRKSIVRREVWFDEPWSPDGADLMVFYHRSEAVNPAASEPVHSLDIDLTQGEDSIWKNLTSTTRNLVNRARKEGLFCERWDSPSPGLIAEFLAFHREFSLERGMHYAEPVWMYEYAAQGALALSRACSPDSKPQAWHSYYKDERWVRLLHSVSLSSGDPEQRKVVGWANRLLHWADILDFRNQGIAYYDFGGWYAGSTDEKLLGINAFKEQFGGRKTLRYHSMQAVSLKGTLFLKAREYLKGQRNLVHFV